MTNPILFFDTVAGASPRLVKALSSTPQAKISLSSAEGLSNHFSGTAMGDVFKGFKDIAGKSSPEKTFMILSTEKSKFDNNASIIRVMIKNARGYIAKIAAKVNPTTNEVMIGGKVRGITNYETGKIEARAIKFRKLALDKGVDIETAQKMAGKAQSMGVNVQSKMEEVLAGDIEKQYNPHLVAEAKGNLGLGNTAGHFNKRFRHEHKPFLMFR